MDKKRNIEHKINNLLDLFPVVAILGPRQCGKSTVVKNLKVDWKYYDLESPDDYHLITSDPLTFFELNNDKIIIDEAQQYPDLFKILRGVIDQNRKKKGRFIVTGSSSPEIIKGLTESLAGRIATIEMSPFKTNEAVSKSLSPIYSMINKGLNKPEELLDLKSNYSLNITLKNWFRGGFPEPLIEDNEIFYKQWMEQYVSSYINRDIRGLFPKLNIHAFKRFLILLAQFSGHQLNMMEMARSIEVSGTTIKDYLDIIHQTYLWRNLDPYEKNTLKKVQKSKKGFFRDQGVLHYFLKIKSLDDLLIHPVAGFSFESFVIEEIIRGFQATMATQIEFSYYRTIDKSEIDLIVEGPFGILPIEIKLGSKVLQKSLRGLEGFMSDMNLGFGILVNNGRKIEQLTEKIIQIPINYF
jgi:predicted AAA+ superfamily ATPase